MVGNLLPAQDYFFIYEEGSAPPYDYNQTDLNVDLLTSGDDVLSSWINLPFTWNFFGQSVNGYKVSDNGYITFDQNATVSYGSNTAIPDPGGPNNAIYAFWDDFELNSGGVVRTWEYGAAPHRVICIQWDNVTRKSTAASVTMTLRLYEGASFDIVWDESVSSPFATDGTLGCENASGTDGHMIQSSPMTQFPDLQSVILDDFVFDYRTGTQFDWDLGTEDINISPSLAAGTYDLSGTIKNYGKNSVTTFDLNYQLDNGPVNTQSLNTLYLTAHGGEFEYVIPNVLDFPTAGQGYHLKVWISDLNGNGDLQTDNDTFDIDLVTMIGNSAPKNILVETFQGTACGCTAYGMDDADDLVSSWPNQVFPVQVHLTGSTALVNNSTGLNTFFNVVGIPMGMVDRAGRTFGQNPVVNSASWNTDVTNRLNALTPVSVEVYNQFDPATREVTGQLVSRFVDYAMGDLRFVLYVVEDNVKHGSRSIDGVVRQLPLTGFGQTGTIPSTVNPGDVFVEQFSFTLDAGIDINDMRLVGALVRYDDNYKRNEVLNVAAAGPDNGVSAAAPIEESRSLGVFPNPASGIGAISVEFHKATQANFSIYNMQGQLVQVMKEARFTPGEHKVWFNAADLPAGAYFIRVESELGQFNEKLIISR